MGLPAENVAIVGWRPAWPRRPGGVANTEIKRYPILFTNEPGVHTRLWPQLVKRSREHLFVGSARQINIRGIEKLMHLSKLCTQWKGPEVHR